MGACPLCRLPPLPFRHPQGGLPFSLPAYPAFGLLSCPLSPRPPSPVGKGETKVFFMQGAPPLASPGLNPGGTGSPCRCGKLNGGFPRRHLLSLPLWKTQRGLAFFAACRPCHSGTRRGACFSPRLPTLPLACFLSPIPPFPAGRGRPRFFHARGSAPCIPGAESGRHLLSLPLWKTQWGLAPGGTGSPCPGGEDHLKRRSSSPPVPPLLGCRHCS